jgi:light-regulated signal transduction histidine kinase (bacteriophytochrome)
MMDLILMSLTKQDLQKRVRELEQANWDLANRNEESEQFAYVCSHDLQEPLRMVVGYAQLLARRYQGKLDQNADEFIEFLVDGAHRMQDLISALLVYSRVGRRRVELEATDSQAALGQALANLQAAIEESGGAVTSAELPRVVADQMQLGQLFQNLIGNAIKFRGAAPPLVHVSAEHVGKEWVFCVRDNGIGIAPEHARQVFLIFQRLHNRSEYAGAGIGLAICKKIIDRHGGRIWVEPRPEGGSAFFFTLPDKGAQGNAPSAFSKPG